MVQVTITPQVNGLYEERMKRAMCVQLVMKEFLSNIALLKYLHYLNLQIDLGPQNEHHRMRLAGVIYYGQQHFTAQVILSDGQIWFHDGIEIEET